MELTQHEFLEELLASSRRDTWSNSDFFPNGWNSFGSLEENLPLAPSNPPFFGFPTQTEPNSEYPFSDQTCYSFLQELTVPDQLDSVPFISQEDEEFGFMGSKVEVEEQAVHIPAFEVGFCGEKKSKAKILGQPSKNLMAERRRRKRLNDRLSMLRSIVPKISKMDRTSILGDTIDYMKELMERINNLKEEEIDDANESKPNEVVVVRNSPKFEVERVENETRVDICCATKPGLLLSTVNALEALGLEIQQCVISCFNDFSMQASCSQGSGQQSLISSEDIKQALFKNAGYGGRCL